MNAIYPTSLSQSVNACPGKAPLTFGDFVAGGYRVWGKRRALGIIRLAVKSHMIEFRGHHRIVIA